MSGVPTVTIPAGYEGYTKIVRLNPKSTPAGSAPGTQTSGLGPEVVVINKELWNDPARAELSRKTGGSFAVALAIVALVAVVLTILVLTGTLKGTSGFCKLIARANTGTGATIGLYTGSVVLGVLSIAALVKGSMWINRARTLDTDAANLSARVTLEGDAKTIFDNSLEFYGADLDKTVLESKKDCAIQYLRALYDKQAPKNQASQDATVAKTSSCCARLRTLFCCA